MERKLVTLRTIDEIIPIDGADAIEIAKVDGWQCVVKKGEFKVKDEALYFEIDSFLPTDPRFEFLRKSSYKKMGDVEGFKLRTIKLRKQLSQGLLLPITSFPELNCELKDIDFAPFLKVVKWDPPISAQLAGTTRGNFPSWIKKTGEERIQNLKKYINEWKDLSFEVTEKLDGSSMTVYFKDNYVGVCSKNLDLLETEENSFWKIANKYNLKEKLTTLGRNIAIQGELVGEGVQGNPYKLSGQDLYVFNIWDIDKQYYLPKEDRVQLISKLDIKHVPQSDHIILNLFEYCDINSLLRKSEVKSYLNINVDAEGLVYKSTDGSVSFKVINNEYLLGNKGEQYYVSRYNKYCERM